MFIIPTWNQLDDQLPDSKLDPFRNNDCGEECCAMAIWAYRGGLSFSAGCLRQSIPGHSSSGLTNAVDIRTLLHRFRIESDSIPTDHPSDEAHSILGQGKLCIVLTHFSLTNPTTHWRLCIGRSSQGIMVNDPWGGVRRAFTDEEFHKLYAGLFIGINDQVPGWVPTE